MNQAPKGTHASTTPQSPARPAQDPVEVHLCYWLNLGVIGVLTGEPWVLMAARIEIGLGKIPNRKLAEQLQEKWSQFAGENLEKYCQKWKQKTLAHPDARPFRSDLEIMLEDKEDKMNDHLDRLYEVMANCKQIGNRSKAEAISNNISLIKKALGRR